MADRPGVEQVLTRLNDLADRLVSNKRFDDLTELVQKLVDGNKKLLADNESLKADLVKATKTQTERSAELEDFIRKELKKLREETLEAVERVEVPEGLGDDAPKWVKEGIDEIKGLVKMIVGDDPKTLEAIRDRVRGFVKGDRKKALTNSDDE